MNIKLRLQRRQSSKTTALNLLSFDFYLISLTHATQCRHITRESVKDPDRINNKKFND